jgi:putative transposase
VKHVLINLHQMRSQIISVKFKLKASKEEAQALMDLSRSYRDALNYVSTTTFEQLNKTSSNRTIQEATYKNCRENFKIGAQLSCTVSRVVASTYKQLWTKAKQHKLNLQKGYTKKHYKGLDQPPKFSTLTTELQYKRDYSWSKEQTVSVATLNGRIKLKFFGYQKHLDFIKNGARCGSAKLWFDPTKKHWYLIVSLEITKEDTNISQLNLVKGVDAGQRNLIVSIDSNNQTTFKKGGFVKQKCRNYAKTRKSLQSKDTRGAKRILVRLAQRERRFRADVSHNLAKGLLQPNSIIGLEDLSGIRERTLNKRRKGPKASTKQRRANQEHSSWSYAQISSFVEYKSFFFDSVVLKVDARNTSKGCSKCAFISDENRKNGSLLFECQCCSYKVHSDLNAAKNILSRTLVRRQDLLTTGHLSIAPEASNVDDQPEGGRSLDASPQPCAEGI